ncbi:MAG: hypothetical protein ACRDNB_03825 [Gaiellaceae bacterium]
MTQTDDQRIRDVDPDGSPYTTPAVEGLPFDRDSAEAKAIRQILGRREARRPFWRRLLERHA